LQKVWEEHSKMNKHNVFTVGGSDMFGVPFVERIKEDITCNVDAGYKPAQALKHWTGNAGKVLKWSGPKDPYPTYQLGTIKAGAYADLLLWDGNPLDDIKLILDESKLNFIMKDGLVMNPNLLEYKIPSPFEMPLVHGIAVESRSDSVGPHGAKECGEGTEVSTLPAIVNAIHFVVLARPAPAALYVITGSRSLIAAFTTSRKVLYFLLAVILVGFPVIWPF